MTRVREIARDEDMAVASRLEPYVGQPYSDQALGMLDDLSERAATLVAVMPPRQHRTTIERLVCPHDPERGRRVIDVLIEGAFVAEDEKGRLRRLP